MNTLPVPYRPSGAVPALPRRFGVAPDDDALESLTIAQVGELYFRHMGDKLHPEATATKRRNFADFAATYGHLKVNKAKRYHLMEWVERHDGWQSPWTRRRAVGEVRAIFGWAARLDLIPANPFSGLPMPHGDRGRPMTPHEYQTLLRHSSPLFRRVLIFLRFTGCRPGEMSAAKWTDLDLRRGLIQLRQHKTAERTGLPRQIMLNRVILKLLAWIKRNGPHPRYIFTSKTGGQWRKNTLYCRVAQIRQECDIASDVTLYGMRHAYAVEAILSGVDIATLAPLMGHKDISMTAYYANVAGRVDHLQAAVNTMFQTRNGERGRP